MSLDARSKNENIEKSLNTYFFAALVTTESLDVHFPGDRETFTPAGATWIALDYILGVTRERFALVSTTGQRGSQVSGMLSINCCEEVQNRTDRYVLPALRDAAMNHVLATTSIPIQDYGSGGNPTVGYFVIMEVTEHTVKDGFGLNDSGIAIWNITASGQYIEAF